MRIHRYSGTEVKDSELIKLIDSMKDVTDIIEFMGTDYPQRVRMFAKSKSIVLLSRMQKADKVEAVNYMIKMFEMSEDTWLQRNILEVVSHFYSREIEEYFLSYARNGRCHAYIKDRILTIYDPAYRRNR